MRRIAAAAAAWPTSTPALDPNPTIWIRGDLHAQHASTFSDEVDASDDRLRHPSSPASELTDIDVAAWQQPD
jgi:hypothetical protein